MKPLQAEECAAYADVDALRAKIAALQAESMKPVTMSPEREAEHRTLIDVEECSSGETCTCAECRLGVAALEAFREVDALRRLPVIATCGDCAYFAAAVHERGLPAQCNHDAFDDMRDIGDDDSDPPSWCPLRGAK